MAITAKFLADFDQFNAAAQAAEMKLRLVTTQTDAVAAGMTKAGHASTASAQMIAGMSQAATTATTQTTSLTGAFHQFDGVLASLGVHIGPEIKGLEDLAGASGKSASQIGLLGTAGLVVGAGLAGWKIGRAIADFFDLDEAIGNATAKLLGFGDVAAQEAGAKADVLARASKEAGHQVTDFSTAMRINNDAFKKHQEGAERSAKANEAWTKAMVELTAAGDGWQGTLDTIDGETVSAIQYYLDAGVAQNALATAYGLTAVQVKSVSAAMAASAEAHQKALAVIAKADDAAAAAIKAHWDDVGTIVDRVLGVDSLKAAKNWVDAIDAMGGSIESLTVKDLTELEAGMLEALDTLARTGHLTDEVANKYAALAIQAHQLAASHGAIAAATTTEGDALYDLAVAQDKAYFAMLQANGEAAKVPPLMAAAAAAVQFYNFTLGSGPAAPSNLIRTDTQSQIQAGRSGGNASHLSPGNSAGVPVFAEGGPTGAGGLSILDPREYVVPEGGALVTRGGRGNVTINVTIAGSVIAERDLQQRLKDTIVQTIKQTLPLRSA